MKRSPKRMEKAEHRDKGATLVWSDENDGRRTEDTSAVAPCIPSPLHIRQQTEQFSQQPPDIAQCSPQHRKALYALPLPVHTRKTRLPAPMGCCDCTRHRQSFFLVRPRMLLLLSPVHLSDNFHHSTYPWINANRSVQRQLLIILLSLLTRL